jgi:hypothetical protein
VDDLPPRVFVSYSDDSPEHAERVLELAQWLRTHGIDAHVDQFEESPEEGWPRWIYTQVRESEFVLVVCTPGYLERCEGEVPRGRRADRAVKFESHLSLQEIHDAEGRNRKFIPLVFNKDDIGECVPMPLRSATHYRLPAQRDDLYRRLSDQPKVRPVPLGALRTYDDDSHEPAAASQSLEALVVKDDAPRKRRKRAWSSGQLHRLLTVGAFGLAFLATALFINGTLTTTDGIDTGPTCRIELTDPNGDAINTGFITLELPAGQEIAFEIENGNTLRFRCPTIAVQARVRVNTDEAAELAGESTQVTAVNDAPESPSDAGAMLESTFMLQAEPGVQTVRLAVPPGPKQPEPEPEPEPEPIKTEPTEVEPTPSGDSSGSLGSATDPLPSRNRASPAAAKTQVELTLSPPNPTLERNLKAMSPQLEACVPSPPKPAAKVTCQVQHDAAGAIVSVTIDDAQLRKQDPDAADCVQREVNSWAPGKSVYNSEPAASRVTLRFGAR